MNLAHVLEFCVSIMQSIRNIGSKAVIVLVLLQM